jgi:integrase
MAKFAKSGRQATAAIARVQRAGALRSIGTARGYRDGLVRAANFAKTERISGGLHALTRDQVINYLEQRAQLVGQKTLDLDRQSLQIFLRTTGALQANERLPVIKSELDQALTSRAYTRAQVERVAQAQQERNALSTQIAHAAGLRAHELLSLRPIAERLPDLRPSRAEKFLGREPGVRYTVTGKGGLTREIRLPRSLADQLEARRLLEPVRVIDRGIFYQFHYDVAGGHTWSQSYSAASTRALGWSAGAHGVRHSYAQARMRELQNLGLMRGDALQTVSQEMGHFRQEITEVYLR